MQARIIASSRTVSKEAIERLLTPGELDVFTGIAQGLANKEIAAKRDVGVRSVEKMREHVYQKIARFGADSVADLTHLAIACGLVPLKYRIAVSTGSSGLFAPASRQRE